MNLKRLQKLWNRFGREDPLWAALSAPGKQGGRWSVDEFLASGEGEIRRVLHEADDHGIHFGRSRALDFGCGVGRLTQALAAHFARVDGVDIAPSMIEKAGALNRHPSRVTYHLRAAPDLQTFADGTFDLVYSVLVLQHIEPETAKRYIREFIRVVAADGVAVFQVPSHRASLEPSPAAIRTASKAPLRREARKAILTTSTAPRRAIAGSHVVLDVGVRNASAEVWPCEGGRDFRFRITLGSHWRDTAGRVTQPDGPRCPLPFDLAPERSVSLLLGVEIPRFGGRHFLELDMVQEHVAWFAESGSPTVSVPFDVEGGEPEPATVFPPAPSRFRDRHRAAYRWLRRLGVVHAGGWLQSEVLAGMRRHRRALETRLSTAPVMEMNLILRSEVARLVQEAGGEVLRSDSAILPGGLHSVTYWARRRQAL